MIMSESVSAERTNFNKAAKLFFLDLSLIQALKSLVISLNYKRQISNVLNLNPNSNLLSMLYC